MFNPSELSIEHFGSFFDDIRNFLQVAEHKDIIEWAEESIDLSDDVSAERKHVDFSLSPFLVEPLRQWEFSGRIREVAVCGIERGGIIFHQEAYWVIFRQSAV